MREWGNLAAEGGKDFQGFFPGQSRFGPEADRYLVRLDVTQRIRSRCKDFGVLSPA